MAWEAEAPGPHQPAPLLSCFWLGLATETPAGDRRVETVRAFLSFLGQARVWQRLCSLWPGSGSCSCPCPRGWERLLAGP